MKLLYYVRQLSLRNKEMGKQAFIWELYIAQYISVLDYRPQGLIVIFITLVETQGIPYTLITLFSIHTLVYTSHFTGSVMMRR